MRAFFDNLLLALGTFWANPLRSLLTLLGIVIGVATVVAMMGLIEGLRIKVSNDLAGLRANVFEVGKYPSISFRPSEKKDQLRPDLTLADMRAIKEGCPSVGEVSATKFKGGQKFSSERAETRNNVQLLGTSSSWGETNGVAVNRGRFYSDSDDLNAADIAVIG